MCVCSHIQFYKLVWTDATVFEANQEDPHQTVQAFIDLVKRHEQMFYNFVYKVHTRGGTLFDNLMRWIELFLTVVRDGIGDKTSVEFLLPHSGPERETIMKEIDEVALYHYKLKLVHEGKVRKRFGRTQKQDDADAEDEAVAALVRDVVNDISFGDLIDGDAEDLVAEDSASDDSSDYSSSDGQGSEEESDDDGSDSEGSTVVDRSPGPERLSPAPDVGHLGPLPRTRAITLKASRSDATAPGNSSDPENKGRLSIAQRLRNSKSMEMLRRGKSLDLPPPPPIPQQYQHYKPYQPKRGPTVSGILPTPLSPQPPATNSHRTEFTSGSSHTLHSRDSSASSTVGTSSSTRGSKTKLKPDVNKPLPVPKASVGSDYDGAATRPKRGSDAGPKSEKKKPKLKKANEQINPPELTHIPKLLPIFVELVRRRLASLLGRVG